MFLKEFEEKGYNLQDLKPYEDFLTECSKKDYSVDLLIQVHHILPVSMQGSNNKNNLIKLSIEDHYIAHLILANCFISGTKERIKNISGCNRIVQRARHQFKIENNERLENSIPEYWEIINKITKELLKGENNPNFGKKLSEEEKQKRNLAQKGKQAGEKNAMFGKIHNDEIRKKISEAVKKSYIGRKCCRFGKKFGPLSADAKLKISITHKNKIVSKETRKKISDAKKKPLILESNVFYCILDLTDEQQFYRICSCGKILYYKKLYFANCAEKKHTKCCSCNRKGKSTSLKGKKVGPRKIKVQQLNRNYFGENNPNYGKKRTEEWKKQHSERMTLKNKIKKLNLENTDG